MQVTSFWVMLEAMKSCLKFLSLVSLFLFAVLGVWAHFIPYSPFDLSISHSLQTFQNLYFLQSMHFVSLLGFTIPSTIMTIAMIVVFVKFGHKLAAFFVFISLATAEFVAMFFQQLIGRERPTADLVQILSEPNGHSFPSAHVVRFVVFYGFLAFLISRKVKNTFLKTFFIVICLLLIVLVGLSRIYLGVHWSSDVIGGYLLGFPLLFFFVRLYKRFKKQVRL